MIRAQSQMNEKSVPYTVRRVDLQAIPHQLIYIDDLGRIYINEQETPLSIADFLNELNRFDKDQPWEIRADKKVSYEKVVQVLDHLRKEKYMNVILAVEPNRS